MTTMEKYEYLKGLVVGERKDSFLEFMKWVEENTDYLNAPASVKYNSCKKGGLLEHSVSVVSTMIKFKNAIAPDISNEQCVIVGLLHDLGKAGIAGTPLYLENEPTERQKAFGFPATIPYRINENLTFMTHAHRSLYLASSGIALSPDEAQAIVAHDGHVFQDNEQYKFKESRLTALLHFADYWSYTFIEEDASKKRGN